MLEKDMCGHPRAMTLLAFAEDIERELCLRHFVPPRQSRKARWVHILQESANLGKCVEEQTTLKSTAEEVASQIDHIYSHLSSHNIHSLIPLSVLLVSH